MDSSGVTGGKFLIGKGMLSESEREGVDESGKNNEISPKIPRKRSRSKHHQLGEKKIKLACPKKKKMPFYADWDSFIHDYQLVQSLQRHCHSSVCVYKNKRTVDKAIKLIDFEKAVSIHPAQPVSLDSKQLDEIAYFYFKEGRSFHASLKPLIGDQRIFENYEGLEHIFRAIIESTGVLCFWRKH